MGDHAFAQYRVEAVEGGADVLDLGIRCCEVGAEAPDLAFEFAGALHGDDMICHEVVGAAD